MRQILKAAGTNSEQVLMWWWSPEADLTKWKLDPKWKMTAVELPDYTEECNEKRPAMEEKCSATETTRWGAVATSSNTTGRVGAGCANPTELLKKVFSIGLRRQTTASTLGVPSPGHAFLQRFQVDQADVEEMLYRWRYGHPQLEAGSNALWARRVVCEAARNISTKMRNNFPEGYVLIFDFAGLLFFLTNTGKYLTYLSLHPLSLSLSPSTSPSPFL